MLPEVRAPPGSTPHMDDGGKEGRGSEEGDGGETGREELKEEEDREVGGEEGEEGEVSMGVGPLE